MPGTGEALRQGPAMRPGSEVPLAARFVLDQGFGFRGLGFRFRVSDLRPRSTLRVEVPWVRVKGLFLGLLVEVCGGDWT